MPDASITSTESTFGTISGTFTADQSTISGTITAITGTVDGSVGVPGPQGPAGAPGVGVPAGGLTGQFLSKASDSSYDTTWSTVSLGNYLVKANNLSDLTNFATARDNLGLGTLYTPTFAGLTLQGSGANVGQYTPTSLTLTHATSGSFVIQPSSGITFPDTTIQTTAFNATALLPYALVDSQAFTGTPFLPTGTTGVTQALGDNDTSLATTAFVQQELLSGTANARNLEVYVRNQTGSTLAAGTIVYINGATGNRPTVTPAQANNDANSAQTFGFVKTSIANNGFGFVIVRGELENINTSALTEGVQLYLSPTTAGTWTTTKPSAPQHLVYVGIVVRAHPTQGVILVAVQNGYEISELHDVKITGPTNGQVLKYDSTQSLWVNGTDVGGVAWGGITGTLSSQTDLQSALDLKANLASPTFSGNVNLTNVSSANAFIVNSGTAPTDFRASLTSTILKVGELPSNPSAGFSFISDAEMKVGKLLTGQFYLSTNVSGGATPTFQVNQGIAGVSNFITKIKDGKFLIDPNDGNPQYEPYATTTSLNSYALLSGATFTGKVNGTATATTAAFNIGTVTAAPTTLVNGDIWITDRLAFRNRFGNTITGLTNNQTNTIATSSDAAFILGITQGGNGGGLRVVNNGTGDSFRVEDETPESTPFVISNTGRVGIGVAPDATAALKVDAGGIKFNDGTTQTTAPVAGPTYVNVQVFGGPASSGSFTWNKPTGAKSVEVLMMSGGGGGGSGARQATTAGRFGGGGGGGAGGIYFKLDADALASSETVTVGAGGAGGAAVTTDTTNGNPGTKGGDSVFGPITCRGGNFGGGGTDTTGAAGATSLWYQWISNIQTVNNRGGVAPAAAPAIAYELFTCATGGGGGASRLANVTLPSGGGAGGNKLASAGGGVESGLTSAIVGGAGGLGGTSTPPVAGTNGTEYWGGTGGGGGYYRPTSVGNPGAAGGWPGGGGGGGGCSDNTFNSGAGAAGGNGVVLIITYCS